MGDIMKAQYAMYEAPIRNELDRAYSFIWVRRIILSCEEQAHFEAARRLIEYWFAKYKSQSERDELLGIYNDHYLWKHNFSN